MITLKFKYATDNDGSKIIKEYRKQYSSVLRCFSLKSKVKQIIIS